MRRALIIACSSYRDSAFTPLKFPEHDAREMAQLLGDKDLCQFDEVEVLNNPTKSKAHGAIELLTSEGAGEDLILLYFSGHGRLWRDGSLALVLSDSSDRLIRSSSILDDELRAMFNSSVARQRVIMLDCCHAGAAGDEGFKRASGEALEAMAQQVTGTFMLAASTKFQPAFECAGLEASAFTSTLLKGVRSGDAAPGNSIITLASMADYVCREVPKLGRSQQPKYWDFGGLGGAPFAWTPKRYDEPWRKGTERKLGRLLAEEAIDMDDFNELVGDLRSPTSSKALFELIEKFVAKELSPLTFARLRGKLIAEKPKVYTARVADAGVEARPPQGSLRGEISPRDAPKAIRGSADSATSFIESPDEVAEQALVEPQHEVEATMVAVGMADPDPAGIEPARQPQAHADQAQEAMVAEEVERLTTHKNDTSSKIEELPDINGGALLMALPLIVIIVAIVVGLSFFLDTL